MKNLTSLERKVLDSIDGEGLLDGILQLVAIESVGGAETPAQQWIAELMGKIGLKVECWDLDFDALAEHPGH